MVQATPNNSISFGVVLTLFVEELALIASQTSNNPVDCQLLSVLQYFSKYDRLFKIRLSNFCSISSTLTFDINGNLTNALYT